MAVEKELQSAHAALQQQFAALDKAPAGNSAELGAVSSQLAKLKVMLTERDLLYPLALADVDALVLARDVLEIGAFWSIRAKDTSEFDRYWSQLKPFYLDLVYVGAGDVLTAREQLPHSKNYEPLVGLSLLRDLASNAISSFHIALETLPVDLVRESPFIQHPVLLERWLMEGSYSNVWRERNNEPREEYRFFVDKLVVTIRCVLRHPR